MFLRKPLKYGMMTYDVLCRYSWLSFPLLIKLWLFVCLTIIKLLFMLTNKQLNHQCIQEKK